LHRNVASFGTLAKSRQNVFVARLRSQPRLKTAPVEAPIRLEPCNIPLMTIYFVPRIVREDIPGMVIRGRQRNCINAGAMLEIVEDRVVALMKKVGPEYEDR
jgi:hypothetical protein